MRILLVLSAPFSLTGLGQGLEKASRKAGANTFVMDVSLMMARRSFLEMKCWSLPVYVVEFMRRRGPDLRPKYGISIDLLYYSSQSLI